MTRRFPEALPSQASFSTKILGQWISNPQDTQQKGKGVLALYNVESIFLLTTIFQAQTKQVLGNRASITPHLNKQTCNTSELYTLWLLITYHWSITQIQIMHYINWLIHYTIPFQVVFSKTNLTILSRSLFT